MTSVTCVIPTALRGNGNDSGLRSVLRSAQQHGDAEVLLVVNNTTARPSLALMRQWPQLRVLYCDQIGPAAARNVGLGKAASDTVLFTDDDCAVPENWVADMATVLQRPDVGAVAGPVGVVVRGTVTAFLDYQRVFDAPPLDADYVKYLITANCGVRRDRVTARFDAETFAEAGGEDAEFGYQIRDEGQKIAWCGDVQVKQTFEDDVIEISERFMRYGRASALLFMRCGRWQESLPGVIRWYEDLIFGVNRFRQFTEIVDDNIRLFFATYELFLISCWLIGYLEKMGNLFACALIKADTVAIIREFSRITRHLAAVHSEATTAALARLDIDVARMGHSVLAEPGPVPLAQIGDVLRRYAPLATIPAPVVDALDLWASQFAADEAASLSKIERKWQNLVTDQPKLDLAVLNAGLRSVGSTFRDGCHNIEQLVQRSTELPDV